MEDIDVNNTGAVIVSAQALYDTLRAFNPQDHQIVVRVKVHVGGRSYYRNLRSPALEGDKIVAHEVPQRDF